ncbi:MAG: trimethylamine methyltransferase family protein [Spirochaetaceae bacterium]|nr:trimethylamine methyltransferase family protein [Spirochaetaceae bacterium]
MTDIEQIHETALDLLENPGVRLEHPEINARLIKEGASLGAAPDVIRFPRKMVQEKIALCPPEFRFADRFNQGKILSAAGESVVWSVPGMSLFDKGECRPFTSRDMAGWARLIDRLPNVDGVFSLAMDDIPPRARDVAGLRIIAENTTKHIRVLCFTPAGMDAMVRMKDVVGNYPWFSIGFTAHGPLRWTNLALDIFYRTAGHGIPVTVNGEPMAGVSGPVTLAGSAAVGTAEILAGIVVNQVLEPGRPCIFNLGLAHTFDMRTSIAVTGGPENALFAQLSARLGRFYNIPSGSWVSTESMCPDAQAALEKMCGFLTHLQEKASLIWSVGQLESEITVSPSQAVIDNEMIEFARRYLRGAEVNDSTLALDLIRDVGISGSFLGETHTLERFRDELFIPSILFRKTRTPWKEAGSPRLEDTAEERAHALMAEAPRNGLTAEQIKELDSIAVRYSASLG